MARRTGKTNSKSPLAISGEPLQSVGTDTAAPGRPGPAEQPDPPPQAESPPVAPPSVPAGLWRSPALWPALGGGALTLWSAVQPPAVATYPAVGALARVASLIAVGALVAWLGSRLISRRQEALAAALATTTAVVAALAFRLTELALPALAVQATEPLRSSLQGLTLPLGAVLTCGGLLAFAEAPSRAARGAIGLGLAAIALVLLVPQGWLGDAIPPLWAAIAGLQVPQASVAGVALVPGVLAGRWLLVAALPAVTLTLWLLWRDQLDRRTSLILAAIFSALALAQPALCGHTPFAMAGCGLLLLAVGALALALPRVAAAPASRALLPTVEWLGVALVVAIWLILKANGTRYSTTDEALYYYAARLWTEGKWPYRDFFFSHPPLHIAVPALAYRLVGYHFLVGKWLSVAASLGAGLAVWRIGRRILGVPFGLAALALDLFAAEVLQASTNLTGVNLTACWMLWGVWALLQRRFFVAGALVGAAAATGFYALGMMLAAVALLAFLPRPSAPSPWRRWLRHPSLQVLLGFLAVWGTVTLLGTLLAGDRYLTEVFSYHLAKRAKVDGFLPVSDGPLAWLSNLSLMLGAKDFTVVTYYHAAHLWLTLLLPVALAARLWSGQRCTSAPVAAPPLALLWQPRQWWAGSAEGAQLVLFAAALALVGEFAQFKERYDFYWALILPLLALCAAGTLRATFGLGAAAIGADGTRGARPRGWALGLTLTLALLGGVTVAINNAANQKAYPSEFKEINDSKGAGEVLAFEWLDPPGPPWLGELTRAAFWGERRIRGNIETGVHHYLWNKKRWFSRADEMAAWIRDHSQPDETITGASDYAPLLALLSGRRLAGDHVDTNSKVFDTGAVRLEDFWDQACRDKLKFIVVAPMSYFAVAQLPKRATIMQYFQQDKVFRDPKLKHWKELEMELWVRKTDAPCQFAGRRGAGPNLDGGE